MWRMRNRQGLRDPLERRPRSVLLRWRKLALLALTAAAVVGLCVYLRLECDYTCGFTALPRRIGESEHPYAANLTCPVTYERLSEQNVSAGALPYLFGGGATGCTHCRSSEFAAEFCRFELEGHGVCAPGMRERLIRRYLRRGFADILTFTPCDLWPLIAGRTLWFAGDSQTQDFFKALQCFLYEFTDLGWHQLAGQRGETKAEREAGFNAGAAPGCVLLPGSTRLCFLRCDTAACMMAWVLPTLAHAGRRHDILLLNFGLHFSKTYRQELVALVKRVKRLRRRGNFPFLIWKDTPPQHFYTLLGEYPGGGPPFRCRPLGRDFPPRNGTAKWTLRPDHSLAVRFPEFQELGEGGWRNRVANSVMRARGVPVVGGYNESAPLWDFHRDNGAGHECTHYCHPSAPQVWVWALYDTLRNLRAKPLVDGPAFPRIGIADAR